MIRTARIPLYLCIPDISNTVTEMTMDDMHDPSRFDFVPRLDPGSIGPHGRKSRTEQKTAVLRWCEKQRKSF